jgi:hypothetical protein
MHALMMTTVLVSGLACGDGGEVSGADLRAVCVNFDGEWEGIWYRGRSEPRSLVLTQNLFCEGQKYLLLDTGGLPGHLPVIRRYALLDEGGQRLKLFFQGGPRLGIYKVEAGRVHICFNRCSSDKRPTSFVPGPDEELWILKPAEPAKPK